MQNKVLILDFGSQVTQLIARRVRELNIYCEIHPFNSTKFDVNDFQAVILSGSPYSVRNENAPHPDLSSVKGKKPLLGICYGAQYLVHFFGGTVGASKSREYGRANLSFLDHSNELFDGISEGSQVWMSHSDTIIELPDNYKVIASTDDIDNAAYKIKEKRPMPYSFTQRSITLPMDPVYSRTFWFT